MASKNSTGKVLTKMSKVKRHAEYLNHFINNNKKNGGK
jgi:hypothetical protein